MISDATTISKPSDLGKPLATPPKEPTMERRARSFISTALRQAIRRSSNWREFPQ